MKEEIYQKALIKEKEEKEEKQIKNEEALKKDLCIKQKICPDCGGDLVDVSRWYQRIIWMGDEKFNQCKSCGNKYNQYLGGVSFDY